MIINRLPFWLIILSTLFFTSCGTLLQKPLTTQNARLGEVTQAGLDLRNLPKPAEELAVAVYQFRDQTGQYKANGGFSTAVTQGGTNILLKALKDSGWFIPIERENVNNLLQERKIIRSTRTQLGFNEPLNPLLYASVILEGGIVSYDTNVLTGGAGLRYFGAGGSEQYRQDRVTVYLRVISVRTGEVLKVVYTSKKVLSQSVDAGLFQYVSFKRLLEFETGFTYNEPGELAVREAIEKAVQSLVLEGIIDGLWTTLDVNDTDGEAVKAYKEEKNGLSRIDVLGKEVKDRRSKVALQFSSTSTLYNGDYPDANLRSGIEVGAQYNFTPSLGLAFHYAGSNMTAGTFYDARINYGELVGEYRLLPYDAFTPYIVGGVGFIAETEGFLNYNKIFPKANIGGGLEYMFNQKVGFRFALDYNYILSDELDNIKQGNYNDAYWRANLGVSIYFGNIVTGKRRF